MTSGFGQSAIPGHPDLSYQPVDRVHRRRVLAMLLTGQDQPQHPGVDQFLSYAQEQGLALSHLWWALREGHPVVAAMLMPCAGRTGMMYLGPGWRREEQLVAVELLRRTFRSADPRQVQLVQTLLEPRQTLVEQTYQQAGFTTLATLVYLENNLQNTAGVEADPRPRWEQVWGVQTATYSATHHDLFAHTILASYRETLDCPGLLGLRHIEDILDGHRSIGRFDPGLWHVLHRGEEPVGVMLLNPLPTLGTMELVYLGMVPSWRGKGLGKALLRWGLELTRKQGLRVLMCAVDAANTPAVRLYESLGFVAVGRKVALIHPVPSTQP